MVSERQNGLTFLRVMTWIQKRRPRIATDEPDYAIGLGANPEFNTTTIQYSYTSMVTPSSVYEYDLNTKERKLLKRQEVLGGYDPASYEAQRIWSVSRDGTKVPISLVYKKGVKLDGRRRSCSTATALMARR